MTVAVCHVMPAQLDVAPPHTRMPAPMPPPRQLDTWSAIQTPSDDDCATKPEPPMVKPKAGYQMTTVRRSMSHESLSLCTESLGCETGTRGDFLDLASLLYTPPTFHTTGDAVAADDSALQEDEEEEEEAAGELSLKAVQYHRARPQRAFPPPLPSMSRRSGDDAGPCLRLRPHRRHGRLVLEAVAAKPQGYLHAQRQDGRLKLCFVDCSSASASASVLNHQVQKQSMAQQPQNEDTLQEEDVEEDVVVEEEEDDEEEEDEVEVVDRGTVVEVVAASGKAQRCSRIVINKFVGGAPATTDDPSVITSPSRGSRAAEDELAAPPVTPGLRRVPSSTTTLAAAVAAASTGMQTDDEDEEEEVDDKEEKSAALLFTSRVGDREELVQSVRRCRQLRQRPLFIVEPYSIIAT